MQIARTEAHLASEEIARGSVLAFPIELGDDVTASCDKQVMQIVGTTCNGMEDLTKASPSMRTCEVSHR